MAQFMNYGFLSVFFFLSHPLQTKAKHYNQSLSRKCSCCFRFKKTPPRGLLDMYPGGKVFKVLALS